MDVGYGTAGIVVGLERCLMMLHHTAIEWVHTRKISKETLAQLPVASGTVFFPDLNAKSEALFFRYKDGWKARAYPEKAFVSGGGFKPSFWNLEAVLEASASEVYITEGEIDCLALVQAGIPAYQVISVPTGARAEAAREPATAYPWAHEALKAGLGKIKKIIWCGDTDVPGEVLRGDMAKIFGTAKFYFVKWPEAKDANDLLIKYGEEELFNVVSSPRPWPQEGLFSLGELPEPPAFELWTPEVECLTDKVRFAPRTLSIVSGNPGSGKSILMNQLIFEIIKKYDIGACVASFETRPIPHIRRQLRTLLTGMLEYDMSPAEQAQADAWINEKYRFILHPEEAPTLEWLLDVAETSVIRNKSRIVMLDPWNRLESARNQGEQETEYILRCLKAMHLFAQDMNCLVLVVAHPSKVEGPRRGQAPVLEDIAGSRAWETVPDQGIVIHRPYLFDEGDARRNECQFFVRKSRYCDELGFPRMIWLNYDTIIKRFVPLYSPDE